MTSDKESSNDGNISAVTDWLKTHEVTYIPSGVTTEPPKKQFKQRPEACQSGRMISKHRTLDDLD